MKDPQPPLESRMNDNPSCNAGVARSLSHRLRQQCRNSCGRHGTTLLYRQKVRLVFVLYDTVLCCQPSSAQLVLMRDGLSSVMPRYLLPKLKQGPTSMEPTDLHKRSYSSAERLTVTICYSKSESDTVSGRRTGPPRQFKTDPANGCDPFDA